MLLISCGIAAGIGLGAAAANGISALITRQTGVSMPTGLAGSDAGFAMLLVAIASVAALAAAWLAYWKPVADVLRGNG